MPYYQIMFMMQSTHMIQTLWLGGPVHAPNGTPDHRQTLAAGAYTHTHTHSSSVTLVPSLRHLLNPRLSRLDTRAHTGFNTNTHNPHTHTSRTQTPQPSHIVCRSRCVYVCDTHVPHDMVHSTVALRIRTCAGRGQGTQGGTHMTPRCSNARCPSQFIAGISTRHGSSYLSEKTI